jgi:hypothetical protein
MALGRNKEDFQYGGFEEQSKAVGKPLPPRLAGPMKQLDMGSEIF